MGRATRDGTREDEATHLDTTPITFECSRAAENIPCGGVAARRRVNAPDDATKGQNAGQSGLIKPKHVWHVQSNRSSDQRK